MVGSLTLLTPKTRVPAIFIPKSFSLSSSFNFFGSPGAPLGKSVKDLCCFILLLNLYYHTRNYFSSIPISLNQLIALYGHSFTRCPVFLSPYPCPPDGYMWRADGTFVSLSA